MAAKVRVAGSGMLYDGERFLLAQRNPNSRFFGGFYSFIGGSLEEGESPVEATRREVEEEIGVVLGEAHPCDFAGILTTPPFSPIRFETHFFAFPWDQPEAPRLVTDELVDLRWETAAEWIALWRRRELLIPPPVLHFLAMAAELAPGPKLWERCREESVELDKGELHRICFEPDLVMAPLRTPTIPPAMHTNTYLVGEREGFVVDPASTDQAEQARLDRLIKRCDFRPTAAVLTHHHHDHSAGALAFAQRWDIPLLAHPLGAERVEGAEGSLAEGAELKTDARSWRAVHTPGHAPGHIVLLAEGGSVIAGDLISTVSTIVIDPPEGDMSVYLNSLERVRELGPSVLFPSHGPPAWSAVKTLDWFLSHRSGREAKIAEAVPVEGASLEAVVAEAYADKPVEIHPLASRSALAHLIRLEQAGRVRRSGELWARV